MIVHSPTPCPSCGDSCADCGDRTCSANGPAPAPRCAQHPCCTRCDDAPVYCRECKRVLAEVAEDRAEQATGDASREAS